MDKPVEQFFNSRDLGPVERLDASESNAERVSLDEGHADVAVVEEARLVFQDVLRQQPREISNLIHKLIDRKVGRL